MNTYRAVIFDLDGVIVSTDEYHYLAWKHIADQENIYFDYTINHRMRGISRSASLDVLLEQAPRPYSEKEKQALAEQKNAFYTELLKELTPHNILPGVMPLLSKLTATGLKKAIGSSSRNAPLILAQIGLMDSFDVVADGNQISHTKPDPEVFLLAAKKLGIPPEQCIVVEDAPAGIEAALRSGAKAVAVGGSISKTCGAHYCVPTLNTLDFQQFLA